MKKIFFLLVIALLIFACKKYVDCCKVAQSMLRFAPVTLNGIDSAEARTLKTNFKNLKSQDLNPIRQSIWFDSATFHHMVTLLLKERGQANAMLTQSNVGQTDGLRIYFISSAALKNNHLENAIALVSTKNLGGDQSALNYSIHADYYQHDLSDALFANIAAIKGQVETQTHIHPVNKEVTKQPAITSSSNPHYISKQTAYAMQDYYGTAPVSTISEWFDIKILVALDRGKHDGVRIYFARHKPLNVDGSNDKEAGKEAFVLVQTVGSGNSHIDSFLTSTSYDTNLPTLKTRALVDSGAFDKGELCPENCNVSN